MSRKSVLYVEFLLSVDFVLCSDIHLSHTPPVSRSDEPNWYKAMHRPLSQLLDLTRQHDCPLVIAGDIFDRWHANQTPELINFALKIFGKFKAIYAIPGQHDLPYHRMDQKKRSAYYTLSILPNFFDLSDIKSNQALFVRDWCLWPFPWGEPIIPCPSPSGRDLAILHAYIWIEGCAYPGVGKQSELPMMLRNLEGYSAAVFGDNHKGFLCGDIVNTGTLMRRTSDEVDYLPFVGLLHSNGRIEKHYLKCDQDVFLEKLTDSSVLLLKNEELMSELCQLGDSSLDFRQALETKFTDLNPHVRDILSQALDSHGS